jgi:hypothetical protein
MYSPRRARYQRHLAAAASLCLAGVLPVFSQHNVALDSIPSPKGTQFVGNVSARSALGNPGAFSESAVRVALVVSRTSGGVALAQSFEAGQFPPTGWQNYAVPGYSGIEWSLMTSDASSGIHCAVGPGLAGQSAMLATPLVSIATGAQISLWAKKGFGAAVVASLNVTASASPISGASLGTTIATLSDAGGTAADRLLTTTWARYTVDLAAYAGQSVYLGLHNVSGKVLYLDSITVASPLVLTPVFTDTQTVAGIAAGASALVSFAPWSATAGPYELRAVALLPGDADTSNNARTVAITVSAALPVLENPPDQMTGGSPSPYLVWRSVAGAVSYQVQVSTSSGFSPLVVDEAALADTIYGASGLSDNTQYYWRARANAVGSASAWSAPWSFITAPGPADAPLLVSPPTGDSGVAVAPLFVWHRASGATSYSLQVSTVWDFASTAVSTQSITDTFYTASGLTTGTHYFWHVNALKAGGTTDWSTSWEFVTAPDLPSAVVLVAPLSGDTVRVDSCRLLWRTSAPRVNTYRLELATDSSMAGAFVDSTLWDTTTMARFLQNSTTYWWRVKAKNLAGWGPWSAKRSFRVEMPVGARAPATYSVVAAGVGGSAGLIRYGVPVRSYVRVVIYDMRGREVLRLADGVQSAGYHTVALRPSAVSVGQYVVELRAGERVVRESMCVVR